MTSISLSILRLRKKIYNNMMCSVSKCSLLSLAIFCLQFCAYCQNAGLQKQDKRVRVIITSDFPPIDVIPAKGCTGPANKCSDPDDLQSMVRFLLYTNDLDVEGLVASAGTFANISRKQNMLDMLNVYDMVDENLRKHDQRYPTAAYLNSITWQGHDNTYGKPAAQIVGEWMDSEASNAIISVVDKPDTRPVWICCWGGSADVAQAVWKVKATRNAAGLKKFLNKLRIYLIGKQDGSAQWLLDNFPELFVIISERNYMGMFYDMFGADAKLADLPWINKNIREDHGPLGALYPKSGFNPAKQGQQEGDTPSFLYLVSAAHGLNDPEKPDQESWGGKFTRPDITKNHWFDDPTGTQCVSKWRPQVQKEFAERADWMLN
jgi:hypothetical protein